jgi:hypothetical protein
MRDPKPFRPRFVALFLATAVITALIVGGLSYALIAGPSAALGLLIVAGIRRVS